MYKLFRLTISCFFITIFSLALLGRIPTINQWLMEAIEGQLHKATKLPVKIDSLSGLFPLFLQVNELVIGDPGAPLLYCTSLEIVPEWHELLFGRLSFSLVKGYNIAFDESKFEGNPTTLQNPNTHALLPEIGIRTLDIQNFRLCRQNSAFNLSGSLQTDGEYISLSYSLQTSSLFGTSIPLLVDGEISGSLDELIAKAECSLHNHHMQLEIDQISLSKQTFATAKLAYKLRSFNSDLSLQGELTPVKDGPDRIYKLLFPKITAKFAPITFTDPQQLETPLFQIIDENRWRKFSTGLEATLSLNNQNLTLNGSLTTGGEFELTAEKCLARFLMAFKAHNLITPFFAAKEIETQVELFGAELCDIRSSWKEVQLEEVHLDKTEVSYLVQRATPAMGHFAIETVGDLNFHCQGHREIKQGARLFITLQEASFGDRSVLYSLQSPVEFFMTNRSFKLSYMKFQAPSGAFIEAECAFEKGKLAGTLQGADLPLLPQIVRPFIPVDLRPPKGIHTFSATLTGPLSNPHFQCFGHFLVEFQVGDERKLHRLGYSLRGNSRQITFLSKSTEEGGRLEMSTNITIDIGTTLQQTTMTGTLQGRADLHILSSSLFPPTLACEGIIESELSWQGSLLSPHCAGTFKITEGAFEIPGIGGTLCSIQVKGNLKERVLEFENIEAKDSLDGQVSGYGSLNFASSQPISYELVFQISSSMLVERDIGYAKGTGSIMLRGVGQSLQITGDVIAENTLLDLSTDFSQTHPILNVEFENAPPLQPPKSSSLEFDISVHLGARAEIRGRGLSSSWKGDVRIVGPSDRLKIIGAIACKNGLFHFAGKDLKIRHGEINVNGNILRDSQLNILAETTLPPITAQAILTGSLERPKIRFQSTPALSEKEIISYIMFNKSFQEISPIESLQLAHALVELQQPGGPFSLIESFKNTLMIDRLDLTSDSDTNEVTVQVGKYISDNVIVTVSKDISSEANRVGLGVDVTPHVRFEAEVGDDADGIISLTWKRDY